MSVNDKILDAIELLAKSSVERAGYDKTIQAQVIACQDKITGKYKCKYQDAVFFAYVGNPDISLSNGSLVYILVPENDMSKDKTIIGTVEKLGTDYIAIAEGEAAYEKVGVNTIESSSYPFYLDTRKENYKRNITSNLVIKNTELKKYINKSSSLIVAATIRTKSPLNVNIDTQTIIKPKYGIIFTLAFGNIGSFEENTDGVFSNVSQTYVYTGGDSNIYTYGHYYQYNSTDAVWEDKGVYLQDFVLDENEMISDPYALVTGMRQSFIFPIDGVNFNNLYRISIYNNYDTSEQINSQPIIEENGDIIISNLEIYGANQLSEQQLNGIIISFITPQGTIFLDNNDLNDKQIIAQIKKGGNKVPPDGVDFYWGRANMNIDSPQNAKYNQYLGYGWQLLTSGRVDSYIVKKSNAAADHNYFKVAAIYDGTLVTRQIDIENLVGTEIVITSDSGTEFFNNTGSPNLECTPKNGYIHRWGWRNNGGSFERAADVIGSVNGAQLSNIQIAKINNYADFACTVEEEENGSYTYIGTGFITLTNVPNEKANMLTLINGQAVYKYTESGVAPTSPTLQNPQLIKELGFILRDGQGVEVYNSDKDSSEKLNSLFTSPNYVKWYIPNTNTLFDNDNELQSDYIIYENSRTVPYKLKNSFDYSSTNNQIKLEIFYNGIYTQTQTQFMFTKQGDIGTNGTEYTVKIVPTTNFRPQYPMIIKKGNVISSDFGQTGNSFTFEAQLWRSGELIWEGTHYQNSGDPKIKWSVLQNHYSGSSPYNYDQSDLTVTIKGSGNNTYTDGTFTYTHSLSDIINTTPSIEKVARANIIKCEIEYENKIYYGTLPIITAQVINDNDDIKLEDGTGFIYVIYTTDGLNPQYNKQAFTINYSSSHPPTQYNYIFMTKGTTINNSSYNDVSQLEEINDNDNELLSWQHKYKPKIKYNGECVTNSILCIVKNGNNIVGKIRIPVHLFLNRYGHANLNAWDGNSIQIDDNGHYILAPQIGAGVKDETNGFTGVVMGEVKEAGKSTSQIGLFGYASGARSFFLDSETGKTILGKYGASQITIDPSTNGQAKLYSGSFYNPNGTQAGNGLLINLTTPEIRYGNKNFEVDSSGNIKAGYQNSDWNFKVINGNVTLIGNLQAGKKSYTPSGSSQPISYYNFEVNNSATNDNPLIRAGSTNGSDYNFIVEADGDVTVKGAITANSGKIGGSNGWAIGSGYISSNSRTGLNDGKRGVYFGTDGISINTYNNTTVFEFDYNNRSMFIDGGSITLSKNTQVTWGNYTPTVEDLIGNIVNGNSPNYISGTFINGKRIESPDIYAGHFYATGSESQATLNTGAAYYIYDGYSGGGSPGLGNQIGYICYDTGGSGSQGDWEQATKRVIFATKKTGSGAYNSYQTALKLKASGSMSLQAGYDIYPEYVNTSKIYLLTATQFSSNIKLEQLHPVFPQYSGYCHYIGAFGYYLPPEKGFILTNYSSGYEETIDLQYGQLFFKLI